MQSIYYTYIYIYIYIYIHIRCIYPTDGNPSKHGLFLFCFWNFRETPENSLVQIWFEKNHPYFLNQSSESSLSNVLLELKRRFVWGNDETCDEMPPWSAWWIQFSCGFFFEGCWSTSLVLPSRVSSMFDLWLVRVGQAFSSWTDFVCFLFCKRSQCLTCGRHFHYDVEVCFLVATG